MVPRQLTPTVGAGTYSLDAAILTEDGARAHVKLAIEGVRGDGWYALSQVQITECVPKNTKGYKPAEFRLGTRWATAVPIV